MKPSETGAHLEQLICAMEWVKTPMLNFSDLIERLQRFMETSLTRNNAHERRGFSEALLFAGGWGKQEADLFYRCHVALVRNLTLAKRVFAARICILMDVSMPLCSKS